MAVFDLTTRQVQQTLATSGEPTGMVLSSDGQWLYVTCAGPEGAIDIFDAREGRKTKTVHTGHTPMSPVLNADGAWLYVCNRFSNSVSVMDTASGAIEAVIPVVREPIAAALAAHGKRLLVANHLPAGPADGDYLAAGISIIDAGSRKAAGYIQLPNGSTSLRGICLSPDGRHAYVTHLLARYQLPATQLDRGWMNTNALSIVDAAEGKLVNTVLLDEIDRGAANPWGVICTPDGRYICVAHAGTHELSVIDREALHRKLARVATGERVTEVSASPQDVPNDLSFLLDIRRRVRLAGHGPRGLTAAGQRLYVAEYFSDSLGMIDLAADEKVEMASWPLGPAQPLTLERRGEMLFNDATLCFQHWQSCASCHPDARADGLNWDLLNDGIGNPKNTRSLLLAHETPPAMSHGVRGNAEAAVRAGIRHILFATRPEEEAAAMDAYLRSLKPVASPHSPKGELSPGAQRGRDIYNSADCAKCHPAPLYTDLRSYDVGTHLSRKPERELDTPTLIESWRTGPYLHDGRAATMEDVLKRCNPQDQHGRTSDLSAEDLAALAEFVLSQ